MIKDERPSWLKEIGENLVSEDDLARIERDRHEKLAKESIRQAMNDLISCTPPKYRGARIENVPQLKGKENDYVLLFCGNYGTGKTYASFALAHYLVSNEIISTTRAYTAFKLMMEIKSGFADGSYESRVEDAMKSGLLIIDEYGKNAGSSFEESVLYEIISERYNYDRRTILITNAKDNNEMKSIVRPDVLDRYKNGIIWFTGESRR